MIEEIKEAVSLLDKIDEYNEILPSLMSNNDLAISDLYHYIENNSLSSKSSYRMIKELKERLKERRKLKNQQAIMNVYNNQKQKLIELNNRKMLVVNLCKEQKKLKTPYKNRIYEETELKENLEG